MPISIPNITGWPQPPNMLSISETYDPMAGIRNQMMISKFQSEMDDRKMRRKLDEMILEETKKNMELERQTEEIGTKELMGMSSTQPQRMPSSGFSPKMNQLAPHTPVLNPATTPTPQGPMNIADLQANPGAGARMLMAGRQQQQEAAIAKQKEQEKTFETAIATSFASGDSDRVKGMADFYSKYSQDPYIKSKAKDIAEGTIYSGSGNFEQERYFSKNELDQIRQNLPPEKASQVPFNEGFIKWTKKGGAMTFIEKHPADEMLADMAGNSADPQRQAWAERVRGTRVADKLASEGPTDFKTFYRGQEGKLKTENPGWTKAKLDEEISKKWHEQQMEEKKQLIEIRYPAYQQASNLPPGIMFNRYKGAYVDSDSGKVLSRSELQNLYGANAVMNADKAVYRDIDKRFGLVDSFVREIDTQIPILEKIGKELGNKDPKYLNWGRNRIKQFMGEGEWYSYLFAINALSLLMTKAETNQLGIGAVPGEQAKVMALIHNPDLSLNDIMKVAKTGKEFGKAHVDAFQKQLGSIADRIPKAEIPGREGQGLIDLEGPTRPPISRKTAGEEKSKEYSKEDLEFTAKKYGISIDEVKKKLKVE